MGRKSTGQNVFDQTLDRIREIYAMKARPVVSFSAGKDSTIVLEMALIVARELKQLPLDVVMHDEEIAYPGTYEFAERTAAREDIRFWWLNSHQPMLNAFNREKPYWWIFDLELSPDEWVRQPPAIALEFEKQDIADITGIVPMRPGDTELINVMGLRGQESARRLMSIHSSGGHMTKHKQRGGFRNSRPIYDWLDGDVWRAINVMKWDTNKAYDVLMRQGVKTSMLRVGPPTMTHGSIDMLGLASRIWPQWFERVAARCPGIRSAAQFGSRVLRPKPFPKETWEECYQRLCIDDAPDWIKPRAEKVAARIRSAHAKHSAHPVPELVRCMACGDAMGSWKQMVKVMYSGDPFSLKQSILPFVQPDFFRAGARRFERAPTVG